MSVPPEPVTYRVYIRDGQYRRIAELTDWTTLQLVLRFNDVGTWTLETNAESREARLLGKTGGIIVTRVLGGSETTIFSGFVWTEWAFTARTFRASGYSDDALLWTPARPTPSIPSPPFVHDYDVRTGIASTIMRDLVNVNIGPGAPTAWKIPAILFPPDPLLGTTITSRANLEPLLTLLAELSVTPYAGGLGFYLRQSDDVMNSLEFVVYAPPDRSADAKFGVELGTAQDYEDVQAAPEANFVYVLGGDGFGTNRTIVTADDVASINEWGRLIATVIDRRGTSDTSELVQAAAEAIAGVMTSTRIRITPFDVPSLQYGQEYDLGTLVTIVTHGGETVDLIRAVEIDLDPEQGPRVTPIVGAGDGSDEERSATIARTIQNRVSNLERNWNVPPDSIDRSMLVPVQKPPIGAVHWLAGNNVPPGYLFCDGTAVSRTTYSLLFAQIGTLWGAGNGTTTFNIPNLRDRSPIGSGFSYGLGQLVGAASMAGPPHTHPGSHSHGLGNHTHLAQPHTHPGGHSHAIASHDHNFDHSHTVWLNPFDTGYTDVDGVGVGHASLGSGATDHKHRVTQPSPQATGSPDHLDTSQGFIVPGSTPLTTTGTDSAAPGAAYTGLPSAALPNSSDPDSTAPAASYGGSFSLVHPSAGLMAVIYAGV